MALPRTQPKRIIDLRKHPRIPLPAGALFSFRRLVVPVRFGEDLEGEGALVDLSIGGCRLLSDVPLIIGQEYNLIFQISMEQPPIPVDAAVVQHHVQPEVHLDRPARRSTAAESAPGDPPPHNLIPFDWFPDRSRDSDRLGGGSILGEILAGQFTQARNKSLRQHDHILMQFFQTHLCHHLQIRLNAEPRIETAL